MNIVVAPDSFKGSLTAIEVSQIIEKAILEIDETSKVTLMPMADGGEGTLDALLKATDSEKIFINCTGPLGKAIKTYYAVTRTGTVIIEGANISGLIQVPFKKRNPDHTTSYGLGEVIIDALNKGYRSFVIGLGGSSTNDGGLGMLQALGLKAWNEAGQPVGIFGKDLHHVASLDFSKLDPRLKEAKIQVACDVDNPLCGVRGATAVYGPQKGATKEQVAEYDQSLDNYGSLVEDLLNLSLKNIKGAGAAGGLGFALLSLEAELVSGAKLIAESIGLETVIQNADLVFTGEGRSDDQTLFGKAPGYVASIAKRYDVPVILISGSLTGNQDALRKLFSGCFSITNRPLSMKQCMDRAEMLLFDQAKQVMHLIRNITR